MTARDRKRHEYRVRLETEARDADAPSDAEEDHHERYNRHDQQALWVDLHVRQAIARGEFDDLPGAGKPIPGIDRPHDPDWWLKQLIERERINDALPEPLALRKADAQLNGELDALSRPVDVRHALENFNARVVSARRQLQGGPPVITAPRDVEAELGRWTQRRQERLERLEASDREASAGAGRPWWRKLRRR